ncbi:MAG: cell division protein FtsA [Nitrospirota bacterium]
MGKKNDLVVGLDIGTTKVCAIVGEIRNESIDIIGIGSHPSRGLKKGVVVNIEGTVDSIRRAVEEAELMSGEDIRSVYVGIAGGHIKGFNSRGVIAIKDKEIKESDIKRVIDAAAAVSIPVDREILHVLPREYIIDEQEGIKEPLGMSGVRFEAEVHIVTGAVTLVQNLIRSCQKAGLDVMDIVLQPLASGEAVLSNEEKELGVVVIDLGGGTTDIAIFLEGGIWHTGVLAVGGNNFTNDIAIGLRTPSIEAEKIKKKYGCAYTELVREDETIEVPGVGGRLPRILQRRNLSEIIQPRAEEIFELVMREIKRTGYEDMIASGAVITGGTAIMEGIPEVAEQVLDLPVRRGIPANIGGLVDVVSNPMYATGVGLVFYGAGEAKESMRKRFSGDNIFGRVLGRMREWFEGFFL